MKSELSGIWNYIHCDGLIFFLNENTEVLKIPLPDIQVVNFGDNSIDLIIYFRAENSNWLVIKSDVMTSIYKNLNEEGIEIPLPQRDLHIKSVDEEVMSEISKKETGKKE